MNGLPFGDTIDPVYRVLRQNGAWSTRIQTGDDLQIVAVRKGECWFECPELLSEPVRLTAGSIVGTTGITGQGWRQGDAAGLRGRIVRVGGATLLPLETAGGRCPPGSGTSELLVATLSLRDNQSLHAFPRLFHLAAEDAEAIAGLTILFDLIEREGSAGGNDAGRNDVIRRASEILLIILARHVEGQSPGGRVWGQAGVDPKVLRAIRLMETEAARSWTVESLATEVGMGRSAFAVRFRELVGDTPLNCLFKTRMRFASNMIRARGSSIANVAEAIGYQSESAFSKAFVRHFGMTPGQYRAAANDRGGPRRHAADPRGHHPVWQGSVSLRAQGLALGEVEAG